MPISPFSLSPSYICNSCDTILFIAGTMALLISCLQHVVKFCFVEQWRVRVFLVLNLVVIAIFFCSIYAKPETPESNCREDMRIKKKRQHRRPVSVEESSDNDKSMKITSVGDEIEQEREGERERESVKIDGESSTPVMSEEELNKRVEAFIAMFRRHLASDARTSRNQFLSNEKHTETSKLQKESSMTPKVRCVVLQV